MSRRITAFFPWTLWLSLAVLSLSTPGGHKAAFRAHYKGMLLYGEGHYQRAVGQFERAYGILPGNYNFGLSLAVALSQAGRAAEGLNILDRSGRLLNARDPEYGQKLAYQQFFRGMIMMYDGRYGDAIGPIRESIELQRAVGEPKLLSIYNNALGYAILLNQGGGSHARDTLGKHYHVHKRDLLRAFGYFDRALTYDPGNSAALYNYFLVRDTLGMEALEDFFDKRDTAALAEGRALPGNSGRALQFAEYDELLLLLDISGSMVMEQVPCMGTTRFDVMQETALLVLDSLPPHTRLGLATIDGDCGTEPVAWEPVGRLSRYDMRYRLRFLVPNGTTPLLERLRYCPELFLDADSTRKAIFLISDGANICRMGGEDVCDWAEEMASRNITVNILTFLGTSSDNTNAFAEYGCLADITGGQILYMDNYRCSYEYYGNSLIESCQPKIPGLRRVQCWGPAVKELWAVVVE
ncbi:MAG: tetratricopeptide repeat protein [Phaeodactylibacter sp.]|nr:tetratricopeptide repeat protein [Phaeodactylibacter sp.]